MFKCVVNFPLIFIPLKLLIIVYMYPSGRRHALIQFPRGDFFLRSLVRELIWLI